MTQYDCRCNITDLVLKFESNSIEKNAKNTSEQSNGRLIQFTIFHAVTHGTHVLTGSLVLEGACTTDPFGPCRNLLITTPYDE